MSANVSKLTLLIVDCFSQGLKQAQCFPGDTSCKSFPLCEQIFGYKSRPTFDQDSQFWKETYKEAFEHQKKSK